MMKDLYDSRVFSKELHTLCLLWQLLFGIVHKYFIQFKPKREDDLLVLTVIEVLLRVA